MANPCMFYGIPCDAGTEGNCVCRKRFFDAPSQPEPAHLHWCACRIGKDCNCRSQSDRGAE